jgi:hypothetical protein
MPAEAQPLCPFSTRMPSTREQDYTVIQQLPITMHHSTAPFANLSSPTFRAVQDKTWFEPQGPRRTRWLLTCSINKLTTIPDYTLFSEPRSDHRPAERLFQLVPLHFSTSDGPIKITWEKDTKFQIIRGIVRFF